MMRVPVPHRKRSLAHKQILAIVFLCASALAQAQLIPRATNLLQLGRLAAARHVPIVLLFWSPTCHYCAIVERDFLDPETQEPRYRSVLYRRIDIASHKTLVDFSGHQTTEAAFAAYYHLTLVPVLWFVNAQGKPLAHPLIGLSTPAFYGAYLDDAIQKAELACAKTITHHLINK